jgi:flagellar assembly protein FliH
MMPQNAQYAWDGTTTADVEVFDYPEAAGEPMPPWEAFPGVEVRDCAGEGPKITADEEQEVQAAARETHAGEMQRSFEAGLALGLEEGRAAERQCLAAMAEAQEARRLEEIVRIAEGFSAHQSRYFENVEREVVRLALGVAARILRRETQMDPLLLSGAVRVALGQLSASTEVRLWVPAPDLELWRDTIAHLPNLKVKPSVVGGDGMSPGECTLETELGCVDLGLGSQLAEIERSFFDRGGAAGESAESSIQAIRIAEDMGE